MLRIVLASLRSKNPSKPLYLLLNIENGGERGIRTPETVM
jgi:hypothetical protein